MQPSTQQSAPRRRGPPSSLQIFTPPLDSSIVLAIGDSPVSGISSESDSLHLPSPTKQRSLRNMNRLSLTLPSARSSTNSLSIVLPDSKPHQLVSPIVGARRRPSVLSLPSSSTTAAFLRSNEGDSPSVPYADGPIEILPNIWLGSEDNARDWKGLVHRGIRSVLNVAKEVACPFDSLATSKPLRPSISTPNLNEPLLEGKPIYYPPHVPSGRPGMHYMKLPWSHGQPDLVNIGLPAAFSFVDEAQARGEGVLIHCQCGISRSGTLIIALVMRAAVQCSLSVPAEVWALKGMQGAYSYVKEKSKYVGPNMSLIYQLLDYERSLKEQGSSSPTPSDRSSIAAVEDEEWGRRRAMMEESSDLDDNDRDSVEVAREARALDKAMQDRIIARKPSASSVASSGIGMGVAWKSRYGGRNRAGSVASNFTTNGSIISENLVEEDEQQELLGVGGGFDEDSSMTSPESQCEDDSSASVSSKQSFPRLPPPSTPASRSTFVLPRVPPTATQSTFDLKTPRARTCSKNRHRPPPLSILPPVPASPVVPVQLPYIPSVPRARVESRRPDPPSFLHKSPPPQPVPTPSQTLFVFPPSPSLSTQTPSTMILTPSGSVPFPSLSKTRVSTRRSQGRRTSFIGVGLLPATPTTAYSRVDARGWVGVD